MKSEIFICDCSQRVCSMHPLDMEARRRSHHRLLAVALAGWLV